MKNEKVETYDIYQLKSQVIVNCNLIKDITAGSQVTKNLAENLCTLIFRQFFSHLNKAFIFC